MKKIILYSTILLCVKVHSQNRFYDYMVSKDNDTIYGTIQTDGLNRLVLREKNKSDRSNKIKFYHHPISKSKSFRYNDKVYVYEDFYEESIDPIYEDKEVLEDTNYYYKRIEDYIKNYSKLNDYVNKSPKLDDYIVLFNNDTIYGKIEKPLIGKPFLISDSSREYKIDIKKVKSYRMRNYYYFNLSHIKKKYKFLELLMNGETKLFYDKNYNKTFGLGINGPIGTVSISGAFYIVKEDKFTKVSVIKYKKQLYELFSENQDLVQKIRDDEFTYENLVLIVKYFNESE